MNLWRTAAVATIIVATAAVVGCARVESSPPPPSQAELDAFATSMLDKTWLNSGLEGIVERPSVAQSVALDEPEWSMAIFSCLAADGITSAGFSYSMTEGFAIGTSGDEPSTEIMQLSFYRCVAAQPGFPIDEGSLLSAAQRDYVYDYYREWVVPCLVSDGHQLHGIPTRERFDETFGQWNPYWSVVDVPPTEREQLSDRCGPERPPLD